MAYQTGTASNMEDLMNLLNTFAVAQGWTSNVMDTTNDWMGLNNGSVFVQFRWDNTNAIAMFHSTGFINTSTAPGNHTNDDGCGTVDASAPYNATISTGRRISGMGNGPYTAYHFFTDGTTQYIHVVLEYSPGLYRHFSFGTIDKIGTWTGGQYAVGHSLGANPGLVNAITHSILWSGTDGGSSTTDANECGSIRIESFPNQTGSMRWMLFTTQGSSAGNDRGGNARIGCPGGCFGANPWLSGFGFFRANLLNGFLPLIPIPIWWRDTTPTPDQYMLLGFAPDVYHIQMASLSPGQEFTIGGDTFKVFPAIRKQDTSPSVEESKNCGIVYRKVV